MMASGYEAGRRLPRSSGGTEAEDLVTKAVPEKTGEVKLPQRNSRLFPSSVIPGYPAGLRQRWPEQRQPDPKELGRAAKPSFPRVLSRDSSITMRYVLSA